MALGLISRVGGRAGSARDPETKTPARTPWQQNNEICGPKPSLESPIFGRPFEATWADHARNRRPMSYREATGQKPREVQKFRQTRGARIDRGSAPR